MAQKDIGNKVPLHTLKTTNQVRDFYNDWGSEKKYDQDMLDWNYTGPKEVVDTFKVYATDKDMLIFDAGCGSGLVGKALKDAGFYKLHGADLSQILLETIQPSLYRRLYQVDLNEPIKIPDNTYDAVTCVGTFTYGHVKAEALDEFVRITKDGGLLCFTINEGIYGDSGFDTKLLALEESGAWEKLEFFKSDYLASKNVNAWLGLFQITKQRA
jgi:SAM-dependent methyltransferase